MPRGAAVATVAPVSEVDGPTVGDLVETVGVGVVDVLAAPKGLDVPIADAVILDPDEDWVGTAGDVVLAIGVDPRRPEARDLIRRAGDVGAAAVVAKVRGEAAVDALVSAANDA